MLKINNLCVAVEDKEIVKGVSLSLRPGEIHALMGPNGSGKSSLAMAVMGHPNYQLKVQNSKFKTADSKGWIVLDGENIMDKTPDERARMGLFLAAQYPVGVEGVTVEQLLRRSVQEKDAHPSSPNPKLDVLKFRKELENLAKKIGVKPELLRRSVNVGFSGGEKKRLEILQMLVLQPKYAILDETDSGLDIDALRIIAKAVRLFANSDFRRSSRELSPEGFQISDLLKPGILVITHYARLLHYLKPDYVHIMKDGKIIESGGQELAEEVEKKGYR